MADIRMMAHILMIHTRGFLIILPPIWELIYNIIRIPLCLIKVDLLGADLYFAIGPIPPYPGKCGRRGPRDPWGGIPLFEKINMADDLPEAARGRQEAARGRQEPPVAARSRQGPPGTRQGDSKRQSIIKHV